MMQLLIQKRKLCPTNSHFVYLRAKIRLADVCHPSNGFIEIILCVDNVHTEPKNEEGEFNFI